MKKPEDREVRYIVEDLIPSGQVHLLAGPSGGGKTSLAFQLFKALEKPGELWCGRELVRPQSWAYVSGDRTARSVSETQERIGVKFPVFSLVDRDMIGKDLTDVILPQVKSFHGKQPDIVYIDGFTALVPGARLNEYGVVAQWLGALQRYCNKYDVTIIGACHTTKQKENEKYKNPRQKVAGSVAWAGFSETVILIEPPDADDAPPAQRNVSLLPRNKPEEFFTMTFDDNGILQMPEKILQAQELAEMVLPGLFRHLKEGLVDYAGLMKQATDRGLSRRTFDRYLAKMVTDGKIARISKGKYEIRTGGPVVDTGEGANPATAEEQKAPAKA